VAKSGHGIFRVTWWGANALLIAAVAGLLYSGVWEYTVRQYLDGFSDAIVPSVLPAEPKVQAILNWMRIAPSRAVAVDPSSLSARDPYQTLNYQQLLRVCGTATNAFLNLAREDNLRVRRLLLLNPEGTTKHVVAEVFIDGRWIVVDPTYRVMMRDAQGHFLTRKELQNPALFEQAASVIPNYPREYNYEHFAHVRLARLPLLGPRLGSTFDAVYPNWDEALDWSLILERKSLLCLALFTSATFFFLLLRVLLGWYADRRLGIPRFRMRENVTKAGSVLLSTQEIEE
jgi:hypothetical protein